MSFSRGGGGGGGGSGPGSARSQPLKKGTAEQRMHAQRQPHRQRRQNEQLDCGLDELGSMSTGVLDDIAQLQAMMVEQGIEGSPAPAPAPAPVRRDPARERREKNEQSGSFVDVLARAATVMNSKDRAKFNPRQRPGAGRGKNRGGPPTSPPPAQAPDPGGGGGDSDFGQQLKRFKELLDAELITPADYERQKEMILSQMGGVPAYTAVVKTAGDRAKEARVAQTKATIGAQSGPRSARHADEPAGDALEQRRLEQKREKEKMVARLTQMGLGNAKDGFVPELEPEPAPYRAPPAAARHGGGRRARTPPDPASCVCGLRPCVCQGDSGEAFSSDDGQESDAGSDESLKTDSDWEDEPTQSEQRRHPPRPPEAAMGGDGNMSSRSAARGYSTRGNASARGAAAAVESQPQNVSGSQFGSMRPAQLRNVYREANGISLERPPPPKPTPNAHVPGKLRSSAGGYSTMPHFQGGQMTASQIARGPRPPMQQSFAGSFGRPRPAGVPRSQSFIFPKSSATAPDLSIMAQQQQEAMQAIAAASGVDLSQLAMAPGPPAPGGEGGPAGPATPVRRKEMMSFGRPRPHGVPTAPEPEPEPRRAEPARGILKMPTNQSFDANQMMAADDDPGGGDGDGGSPGGRSSRSRSRGRDRRSRSQSRERSKSRPREAGRSVLSARDSSRQRSRSRDRGRREYSDDEYSDDYSDDGYSSAGSTRSYESRRSSSGRRAGGASSSRSSRSSRRSSERRAERDPPRDDRYIYSDDSESEDSQDARSSRRHKSSSRSSRGTGKGNEAEAESEKDKERRWRRNDRKERKAKRDRRAEEEAVEQFQRAGGGGSSGGEATAEAAAMKLARRAARKAEKAKKEEQKALAMARASSDNREMAEAEAQRELQEAVQVAEMQEALASERQHSEVAASRMKTYEWAARQSDGQRTAREQKQEHERKLRDNLMEQVPDEEAWIFGREL